MPTASLRAPEPVPAPAAAATGVRAFVVLWLGQLVSLIGSGVTRFALGVWVYELTGSATQFALITVCISLPGLLAAPLAGVVVDRSDRRRVMLASDAGAGLGTLVIAVLLWQGALEVWHVYAVVAFGSVLTSFQMPAYMAATTLLVPKQHFSRSSGMVQLAQAAAGVVAGPIGGVLFVAIGLIGVVLIDFSTFLFAVATLCLVRVPPPRSTGTAGGGSLWRQAAYGWSFIRARPGLFGLLIYFALMNLAFSIAYVLVIPLVRSFASVTALGVVLGVQSAGQLAGSLALTATGGPRRRISGIFACGLLLGLSLVAVGLRPSAPLVASGLFVMMFCFAFIGGCSQAIWQVKVPPDVQGRVFAVRRLISQVTSPVGFLAAGPLADHVFGPLLVDGGALTSTAGRLLGVGAGRGIGLLYLCLAVVGVLSTVWAYSRPQVRGVEEELPDAV